MYGIRGIRAAAAAVVTVLALAGCTDGDGLAADAGDDFTIAVDEAPTFDGCGSSGDITNYAWIIRETPSNMADDVDKELRSEMGDCSFELENAMTIDEVGEWTIELSVTDADGGISSDLVVVEVTGG
ncbi:MAG: hypothetical protein AAF467_04245 [Actinomycetota bacterium]